MEDSLNIRTFYIRGHKYLAVMHFRLPYKAESCIYAVKTLSCKFMQSFPSCIFSCWIYDIYYISFHIIPWQQWVQWSSIVFPRFQLHVALVLYESFFLSAENMDPICQRISVLKVSVHDIVYHFSKQHGTWNPILAAIAQQHNSAHFNCRRVSLASNLVPPVETSGLRFELDLLYLKISITWWVE